MFCAQIRCNYLKNVYICMQITMEKWQCNAKNTIEKWQSVIRITIEKWHNKKIKI